MNWPLAAVFALAALAIPLAAQANLVCPGCDAKPGVTLGAAHVVELVLSTVLQKGVGVLLLGATAIVSLPWLIAGVAVTLFHIPRWLTGAQGGGTQDALRTAVRGSRFAVRGP